MAVGKERRRARPRGAPTVWRVPDELWNRIAMLLPIEEFRPTGGRRWTPPRRILDGVLYVLRTGLSVEGRAARVRLGLDAASAVPALGRPRLLGSDLAPAAAAL